MHSSIGQAARADMQRRIPDIFPGAGVDAVGHCTRGTIRLRCLAHLCVPDIHRESLCAGGLRSHRRRSFGRSWTACTNVSSALAAPRVAPRTGGTVTSTSVLRHSCKPIGASSLPIPCCCTAFRDDRLAVHDVATA